MRVLDLREIQQRELALLKEVDSICRENGFRYLMVGGTLIGAVRHKGFIPWDDDIDISMPRPDYEAFIEYCFTNNVGFDLVSNRNKKDYWHLFAKVCDRGSIIKDSVIENNGVEMGVSMDIFPVDGLGKDYREARRTFYATEFQREILDARNWKKYTRSKTRGIAVEPVRVFFFALSRVCDPNSLMEKIERYSKKKNFNEEAFSACIAGAFRAKEIMEREVYSDYIELEFEGQKFFAPKYYDRFLRDLYGDYMQLPPESKRATHHTYTAYAIDD